MRFKLSISLSRLALASLAAWERCQNRLHKGGMHHMHDTDGKKDPIPAKIAFAGRNV
jgi:hypothetical protein